MKNLVIIFSLFISGITIAQIPNYVPTSGLVGWWPFNGNANDESGNGNNGIVYGAVLTSDRFNSVSSAFYFNNNKIEIPHNSNLGFAQNQGFSVSVWAKKDVGISTTHLMGKRPNGAQSFNWHIADWVGTQFSSTSSTNVFGAISNQPLSTVVWTHIVGIYESGLWKLYMDGILISSGVSSFFYPDVNTPLVIGNSGNWGGFYGSLDDIGIWSRALTDCEVQQLYSSQVQTSSSVSAGPDQTICAGSPATLTASGASTYSWTGGVQNGVSFVPTTSASYIVTGTNSSGCSGVDTVMVTVVPAPQISVTEDTICPGQSIALTASNSQNACSLPSGTLATGLVGYWPFCGNANDESGNGNNGIVNGATLTTDRFGNASSAYSFDGVDDFISVNILPVLGANNRTVSFFLKAESIPTSSDYACVSWGGNNASCSQSGLDFECNIFNSNGIKARIDGTCTANYTTNSIDLNWHMITFVVDNNLGNLFSSIQIYIDGILATTAPYNGSTFINTTNLATLIFGNSNKLNRFLHGKLDDIGIWNRELNAAEIQQLYTLGQATYSWTPGGATTPSITISPSATTSYTCDVTNSNGTTCSATQTIIVNSITVSAGSDQTICAGSPVTLTATGASSYSWTGGVQNGVSYVPTTSTSYIVTGTNSSGCSGTDTVMVAVVPAPVIFTSEDTICEGQSTTLTATSSQNSCTIPSGTLATGLVGYWPFCGNYNDLSQNVNNGSPLNGASLSTDRFGNNSNALNLDGVDDYLSLDNQLPDCSAFTISLWAYHTKGASFSGVLSDATTSSGNDLYFNLNESSIGIKADKNGTSLFQCPLPEVGYNPTPIASGLNLGNQWSHISLIVESNLTRVYVNSSLVATLNIGGSNVGFHALHPVFGKITDGDYSIQYFGGKLDDIGIWNRALTATEIQQLYSLGQATYSWSPGGATTPSITVSPSVTTAYTCEVTNSNGTACSATQTITVNSISVSAGPDQTVCVGSPVTLTATGASSYSWTGGVQNGVSFVPTTSATYIVTGTNSNGCSGVDTVEVTVVPAPVISASEDTICAGQSTTLIVASSQNSCAVPGGTLATGLVGYWPFCGNANDESGNGNHGTVNGAILTSDRFGSNNSAFSFNGTNSTISCASPGIMTSESFSISFWIKPNNTSGYQEFFSQNFSPNAFYVGFNNGNMRCGDSWQSTGVIVDVNQWQHFVIVRNFQNNVKIYKDGVLIAMLPNDISINPGTYPILFGKQYGTNAEYYNGIFDDFYSWNRALNASEIQQLFTLGQATYSWMPGGATTPSITVSPASTTTYSCEVTNSNGTTCSATQTITVNSITVSAGPDQSICAGDQVTLTATGATSYSWTGGVQNGVSFVPTTSATYIATGTNSNGCSGSDTVIVTVLPNVNVNAGPDQSVCAGSSVTLTATGAATYSWTGGVQNGVSFIPLVTDTLVVTGTNASGCVGQDTVIINVLPIPVITAQDSVICTGDTTTLTASSIGIGSSSSCTGTSPVNYTTWTPIAPADSYTNIIKEGATYYLRSQSNVFQSNSLIGPWNSMNFNTQIGNTLAGRMLGTDWSNRLIVSTGHNSLYAYNNGTWQDIGLGGFGCGGNFIHKLANNRIIVMKAGYLRDLYISDNNAVSFTNVTNVDNDYWDMIVAPNGNIYACGGSNTPSMTGLIKSTDNGTSFSQINAQLGISFCSGFAKDCAGNIYTVADNKIFKSVDGNAWSQHATIPTYFTSNPWYSFLVIGSNGDYYYWGYNSPSLCALFKSSNQGLTWSQVTDLGVPAVDIYSLKEIDGNIIAATNQGVYAKTLTQAPAYTWSTGATTQTITVNPTQTTTYTVTVDYGNGILCSSTFTLNVNATPNLNVGPDQSVCAGSSVTLTATGASSYSWTGGVQNGVSFIPTSSGSYIVTGTNSNGCSGSDNVTVTLLPNPVVSAGPDQSVCAGSSVTLTATGANSYSWSGGIQNGVSFIPTSSGSYIVTGTNANGCIGSDTVDITVLPNPVVSAGQDQSICSGSQVTLTATGALTYTWTGGVQNGVSFVPTTSATYIVTGTNSNGCSGSDTVILTILPNVNVNAGPDQSVCAGSSVTLTATGASSYSWTGGVQNGISFVPITSGTYSVTGTNTNGCIGTDEVTITVFSNPIISTLVSDVLCNGTATGSISLSISGGASPYATLWSNGQNSLSLQNLIAGSYPVNVTDANNCTQQDTVLIQEPLPLLLTAQVSSANCSNIATGAIDLTVSGGVSPYNVLWSTGATSQDLSNLNGGTYSVQVTDSNGCIANETFQVNQSTAIQLLSSVINPTCYNLNNGQIDISITGGTPAYSYTWSNGQNTQDLVGIGAGNYSLTVTDAFGCNQTATFNLTAPAALNITFNTNTIGCYGASTGQINSTVTGGVQPYSYYWSNGATTPNLSNVVAGNYTLTVNDAGGCTFSASSPLQQPSNPLIISASVSPINCNGASTGAIDISVSGGTMFYSYAWSNGATTQDLQNVSAGNYTLILTDGNGCVYDSSFSISQPAQPLTSQTSQVNLFCQNGNNGFVNLTVTGGVQPYTYQWSNGATTQDIFNLTAGTYTVNITDANGCQITNTVNISQPAIPFAITGTVGNVSCFGAATGTIDLTTNGGNAPFTYIWSNGASTQDISNITAGSYNVVVIDAQGCQASQSFTISQPLFELQASAVVSNLICATFETGSIDVSVFGGVAPYTYQWSTGAVTEDVSNLGAGTYSVNITDVNGCQIIVTETISAPAQPLLTTPVVQNVSCNGLSDGQITLNTTGGVGPYSVVWSNGLNTPTIDSLVAGTYNVVVTDANGCENELDIQVIQPAALVTLFYSSAQFACIPDTIDFSYPMTDPDLNYNWDFGNGETSTLQNPSVVFDNVGCFTISLTVNSTNGCSVQIIADSLICVAQGPTAEFYSTDATIDYYTGELQLFDNSEGAISSYLWSFGDASPNSEEMNPIHYYPQYDAQSYLVQLTVTDSNGCQDTAEYMYDLIEDFNIYVPNTITVNGDQFNEGFLPVFSNIDILKSYEIEIFNRWGQLVWNSDQPAEAWYGRYKDSRDVQLGTYTWKIKYTDNKSVTRTIAGHVNVIR